MTELTPGTRQELKTPRAAAIAGIIFSVLLTISLVIIRMAFPTNPRDASAWIADPGLKDSVLVAMNLVPFAGIAFLWFIGVVRDRMGQREDRFFATVFLGSGLLFVAMMFVSAAIVVGLATSFTYAPSGVQPAQVWWLGRALSYSLVNIYAMRMAAVFMISTASIALRLTILPQWLEILSYVLALILLLSVGFVAWVELIFPLWVFAVSLVVLVTSLRDHQVITPLLQGAEDTDGQSKYIQ